MVGDGYSVFVARGWSVLPFPAHLGPPVGLPLIDDRRIWREQREDRVDVSSCVGREVGPHRVWQALQVGGATVGLP